MSMPWLFFLAGCFTVFVGGYKIFVGDRYLSSLDTGCANNRSFLVVQPGSGCKQFLVCDGYGRALGPQDCAHGTLFDEKNQTCLRSEDVECTDFVDTSKPDCVTAADPDDCTKYTQCVYGRQMYRHCANETFYHNKLHVCVNLDRLPDDQKLDCGL